MVWDAKQSVVTGKTRVVGIIGYPVQHSLSPLMQNAAFASAELDFIYVPFTVAPENLKAAVFGMKALGLHGFNVTIPHKTTIIPFLDCLDETAITAGAVNTVLFSENGLTGYNTDGDGLVDSLAVDLDFIPGVEQILVLGAGGAARGAISALCRSGAKNIIICNRSFDNAEAIKLKMNTCYPKTKIDVILQNQLTAKNISDTSLLLNTTSIGMSGDRFEGLNLKYLPKSSKVYDMVYSTVGTPLINDASQAGLRSFNGIGMLIAQGERAFKIWTGHKPPEGVMRKALQSICSH